MVQPPAAAKPAAEPGIYSATYSGTIGSMLLTSLSALASTNRPAPVSSNAKFRKMSTRRSKVAMASTRALGSP
ncbi:hypothetical protein O1611_g10510 [Lasiodiplodia mahajangana]|uniref:Uncharacterized protein n=1 Tax=Lasiodiplodia mahajangana TaxID=1108764 RepID=A0ACC2IXG4_9PEZI|nr:hypothetical protein O1611_g10510 [Lasiodiplodia mahajangana]